MSVSGTIAIIENSGLVQVDPTDPERIIRWSGQVIGDATAGNTIGNCLIPAGFAFMPISFGSDYEVAGQDFIWTILIRGAVQVVRAGVPGLAVLTVSNSAEFITRRPVIYTDDGIIVQCITENTADLDVFNIVGSGYLWSQSTVRQLPFRFLWPATIG